MSVANKKTKKRTKAVEYVLNSFLTMGANEAQITREKEKLEKDDYYLGKWLNATGGDFILTEKYGLAGLFSSLVESVRKLFK